VLSFLWLALGIGALLVALAVCLVLLRLNRTLAVAEETLLTADEAMKELVPEIKASLGNLNDITAAVNVGLRTAGEGTARLGVGLSEQTTRSRRGLKAAMYGARVAVAALLRSSGEPEARPRKVASGGRSDG
jgi:hypothetical protein